MNIEVQQERRRNHHYDEIDFMELAKKIWRGRFIITVITFVGLLSALLLLMTVQPYYRIEATIDAVRAEQLRPMRPSILESKAYQALSESPITLATFDGKEYQANPPDEKKIYDKALLQIGSFNNIKTFWESKIGKTLDLNTGTSVTNETKEFKKFLESFELIALSPKTPDVTARKIAIQYQDPKQGVTLLNEYLSYVNSQLWADQLSIIETTYLSNLKSLSASYESRNVIEQNKLNDEIIKLRESLKIAESLNIKETPFKELENIQLKILDSRDYLLGTKTLSQQLDILLARQGKPLSPFVSDLRSMEVWKEQMIADVQRIKELKDKVPLFAVINSAESTIDPVRPKKLLILMGVIFMSAFVGIIVVLVRSAFQSVRAK